jgi:putative FmdB family regulatory protein
MPMYEFRCAECGAVTEALVEAGTTSVACGACGHEPTERLLSTPAPSMHLVKSPGAARQQERRNAELHASTKAKFKETRQKARKRKAKKGEG